MCNEAPSCDAHSLPEMSFRHCETASIWTATQKDTGEKNKQTKKTK